MKKLSNVVALLATAALGSAGATGFSGANDPSTFSIANVGTLTGLSPSPGLALFGSSQLVLLGSNTTSPSVGDGTPGCAGGVYSVLSSPCQIQATASVPGSYAFDWSYVSADPDGPAGDIFGLLVDGQRVALSDLGGAVAQSGHYSFTALGSFGWFINCTDCIGGIATATVSGFEVTPVPEPAAWALMLGGVVGIGVWRGLRSATRRRTLRT